MTQLELEILKDVVRPTITVVRRRLLQRLCEERARTAVYGSKDWKLGRRQGLRVAQEIIADLLRPERFEVKQKEKR